MTRSDDLCAWLKRIIPRLLSVVTEGAEVAEDVCPCALVQYQGDGDGETMDPEARTEMYHVTLLTPNAGQSEIERQFGIAALERPLLQKASSVERFSNRWDHLTCAYVDASRGDGRATYLLTLHVTGD